MSEAIDPSKKPTDDNSAGDGDSAALSRDEVNRMMQGMFKDMQRRLSKELSTSVSTMLAEHLSKKPEGDEQQAEAEKKPAGKETAEMRDLRLRLEKTEKRLQEEANARQQEADARRNDSARAALRRELESASVRGEALDVLVDAMAGNGSLKFDEDGRPQLVVKRARSKGGPVEEQVFDDFAQGIADWKQRPDAAVFLKPAVKKPDGPQSRPMQSTRAPSGRVVPVAPTEDVNAINDQILARLEAQDG